MTNKAKELSALWTVPTERMKAGKEHRVPLSDAALSALGERGEKNGGDLIFPASRGKSLSDVSAESSGVFRYRDARKLG